MQYLTDLEITYGKTLADPGFHKVQWTDDLVHDLMGGTGRSVYIWSRSGVYDGIKEINIFPMNNIPADYKSVNKPLYVKDDISYMLCYSKMDSSLPEITAIKISLDDESTPLTEYTDSDNKTHSTYLWYSTTEVITNISTPRDIVINPTFEIGEFVEYEIDEGYYHRSKKEYGTIVNINPSMITIETCDTDHTSFRTTSVIPAKVSKLASSESFDLSCYSYKKNELNKSESESVKQRMKKIESQPFPYDNDDIEYINKDLLSFLNLYFLKEYDSDTQDTRNRIAEDIYEILLSTLNIILKQFNNDKYPSIFAYYLYIILFFEDSYYSSNQFFKNYNKPKKVINYSGYSSSSSSYSDNKKDEYYPVIVKDGVSIYYYRLLRHFVEANGIEMLERKLLNIYENKVGIAAYFSLLINMSKSISEEYMKEHMNRLYSQLCDLFKEKMMNGNDNSLNNSINSSNNGGGNGNNNKKKNKKSYYFEFFSSMSSNFKKLKVDVKLLLNGTLMMIEADIKSKVTERMINGFENLNELNPKSYGSYKYYSNNNYYYHNSSRNDLSDEDLIKWLDEKKIMDLVFSSESGVELTNQLFEKVAYYVDFMFRNNILPSYVIDKLLEYIDSQYINNNMDNNDIATQLLENIVNESDDKCLDALYNKIGLIKDTRFVSNMLLLLTKRYHTLINIKPRDSYSSYYDRVGNGSKFDFDKDMEDLANLKEVTEDGKKKLQDFITKFDHYNFISYCFDLMCDFNRDDKQVYVGYQLLNEFISTLQKNAKKNVISFLYLKLSNCLNDVDNVQTPNLLFLSAFVCAYYSKLSWFENDMKICISKLMMQFQLFYIKQKKYFESVKYTDEDKNSHFAAYQAYINSIIAINRSNICSCYSFFVDQLSNYMIFEEEEKYVYQMLNDNIKKLRDSGSFIATLELVNKVQFSNDCQEINYSKEFYEFYISILHLALKRRYQLNLECFKGLIMIALYCNNNNDIQNKAKLLLISVACVRYYTHKFDICGMFINYTIRAINTSNNNHIISNALDYLFHLLNYACMFFIAMSKNDNYQIEDMDFIKDFSFILHMGNTKIHYTMFLPSFTVYSAMRKALADQFCVSENRIKLREEITNYYYSNGISYGDIDKANQITASAEYSKLKLIKLARYLQNIPELDVLLNKCLSSSDNGVAIGAFRLLEKYYLNVSVQNYTQFNEGWEKDFDPKYPMKFFYSLKKLRNAQQIYISQIEEEEEDDDDDDLYEGAGDYSSDIDSSSDCSTESENYDNNNNYNNKRRKTNSKRRQQNECGPYDQFIALGGMRMLFNFIIEFDPINFENKQQCITYGEVIRYLFEEKQLIRSEFPIDTLLSTLLNHVLAIYNVLPKHVDIDELNRIHEIQVRKKKRDSKYSTLYNSDDEDNNNNNNNRQINDGHYNFQIQTLIDLCCRIDSLFKLNPINISDEILKQIIYIGVLSVASADIRIYSYKLLEMICEGENRRIYNICISLFEQENIKDLYYHADSVETFFKLITDLQALYDDNFISRIIQCLNDHPILEMDENDEDNILIMYLSILLYYFQKNKGNEDMKSHLFNLLLDGVLFDSNPSKTKISSSSSPTTTSSPNAISSSINVVNPPKCKGKESVTVGMNLLHILCKNSPIRIKVLCDIMSKRLSKTKLEDNENENSITEVTNNNNNNNNTQNKKKTKKKRSNYYYYNRYQTKSATGYVGLKNRSCLCYMNSSLQQFYMMPKFRKAILSIDLPIPDDPEHDLIYQLQRMFSYLQDSEEVDYDTFEFIKALKNSDGSDINPGEQQDSNEFVSLFLQQLENKLSGTNYEKILDELFGGTLAGELKAKSVTDPDKVLHSIHSDPYLFLSLDVYQINDIQHSLETFISGDQVEYKWEETNETLDTTKRTSIKSLPPCLIISLKRFRFDFDSLQNVKVNSRFEFPLELNMKNYTLEGRADSPIIDENDNDLKNRSEDYYHYKLHGVVVHTGTANYGHYYSYINNRFNENWYEFNDSFVGTFDIHSLEHECFGGEEVYGGYNNGYYNRTVEKSRSAFILFYDRVDEYNQSNDSLSNTDLNPIYCGGSLAERRINLEKEKRFQQLQKFPIPAHFVKEIEENNKLVLSNRSSNQVMDDSSYIDNIANLVKDIMISKDSNTYDNSVFESITNLAVSVIFSDKQQQSQSQSQSLPQMTVQPDNLWYEILTYAIEKNKDDTYNKLYYKFLELITNMKDVSSISNNRVLLDLLYDILKYFYEQEDVVNDTIPVDTPDLCTVQGNMLIKQPPISNSKILNITHCLFKYVNYKYESAEKNEVICSLLNRISSISYKLVKYFIECRLFDVILNHICDSKTNLKEIALRFVDRDKEEEVKVSYYSSSSVSYEEMELFYSLFERLKYNFKSKFDEPKDFVAIKLSKEADETMKSTSFLLGLLNNFESEKRDIIKKIINQMYQEYDDDFLNLFLKFVNEMDKCLSEEATYFTYYLLTRGKENPEKEIKNFENIVKQWLEVIHQHKSSSYNESNNFIGICRVCQRCPAIHKILLDDIKNNPSKYEIKYTSQCYSTDNDFKKLLYGVDTCCYYVNNKYLKCIFQSYDDNGEFVPAPPLKIDRYEPEKTIGTTYISSTGKKTIVRYDAKKNKFMVKENLNLSDLKNLNELIC